jgi:hypothetical protein
MSLDTTLLLGYKIAGNGEIFFFGFVEISHRRYKLRRDDEQTPNKTAHLLVLAKEIVKKVLNVTPVGQLFSLEII